MIDLVAAREAYNNYDIDDIGWIRTAQNIAGAFTKHRQNNGLSNFLDTGSLQQSVWQWIIREQPTAIEGTEGSDNYKGVGQTDSYRKLRTA